ncbi:hypothetical protein [Eilatimonas milleporae]|uniref:Uncharacterized protein n=1 Tax=Eilatimonas milleporae TaxID=911205 RepID=A0A3M0CSQ9_9PROT|nr:hypothetical protein [Eilatimonas milleporae]RMB11925.1 hypothetical protein BXY39_0412 [Eilatimonas milleporae]
MARSAVESPLGGGLDLVTPPFRRDPGRAIAGLNYEPRPEGYRRLEGYERTDGRPLPSTRTYWMLDHDTPLTPFAVGETVTGDTSGASAPILAVPDDPDGSGDPGAPRRLVIAAPDGTFAAGETLRAGGVARATALGPAVRDGATGFLDTAYRTLAEEHQRALIRPVPGSGPVRGVHMLDGVLYALRDNAAGSEKHLWRATADGWHRVATGRQLDFTAGTADVAVGATLTGATSGAGGTLTAVTARSGTATGGDLAGSFLFEGVGGAFQPGEALQADGGPVAVAAGADAAVTLPAGGTCRFAGGIVSGFGPRLYWVDGVGPARSFDGRVVETLTGPIAPDTPGHIAVHKDHLFLSYGASVVNSNLGDPYRFEGRISATETGFEEPVTNLLTGFQDTLIITGLNRIAAYYGTVFGGVEADSELRVINKSVGALPDTLATVIQPVFMDAAGLRSLAAVQNYGNFEPATLSKAFKPWLDARTRAGARPVHTLVVREKGQARIFWSDGQGLIVDFTGTWPAAMPMLYDRPFTAFASVEDAGGRERLFAGGDDGMVYTLDSGNSFDGAPLPYTLRLAFNHLGAPARVKRFHKAEIEMTAPGGATLRMTADVDYGRPGGASIPAQDFTVYGGGGFWDEVNWNEFYYSSVEGRAEAHIEGLGANITVGLAGRTTRQPPHTLHGVTYVVSPRGQRR